MAVAITRTELDAAGLRAAAALSKDAAATRRMLALALEGYSRTEAARAAGMDRQTLRDWVHRYNEAGLAGLYDPTPRHRRLRLIAGPPNQIAPRRLNHIRAQVS